MWNKLSLVLLSIFALFSRTAFTFQFPSITSLPFTRSIDVKKPQSLYFTGAGIYIWWQMGAAKYIQEHCSTKSLRDIPVLGASAGSITATLLLTGADFNRGARLAEKLAYEYELFSRESGLYGIWGTVLREWLYDMIPEDLDMETVKNLQISLTPSLGMSKLVSNFENREDLVEAILASCHIPLVLDGRALTNYKGEAVLDGSFWYFFSKNRFTGLPIPSNVKAEEITWVDYGDDEAFTASLTGTFISLITPEDMYSMIDKGYDFMKKEHSLGRISLPAKRKMRLSDINYIESVLAVTEMLNTLPGEMKKMPERISLPRMPKLLV